MLSPLIDLSLNTGAFAERWRGYSTALLVLSGIIPCLVVLCPTKCPAGSLCLLLLMISRGLGVLFRIGGVGLVSQPPTEYRLRRLSCCFFRVDAIALLVLSQFIESMRSCWLVSSARALGLPSCSSSATTEPWLP